MLKGCVVQGSKLSFKRKALNVLFAFMLALMCGPGASAAFAATQDASNSSGAAALSDASSSASESEAAPASPGAASDAALDANVVKSGDSSPAADGGELTEPVEAVEEEGSELSALEESPADEVRALIQRLPADPTKYTAGDRAEVEAVAAAFDALDEDDRAALDAECSHPGTDQPLGRVLEIALWAVWSYVEVDDFTTLADGTYTASTSTALWSEYSKGKSTSLRNRPWHVKSVQVAGNAATATVTVDSKSYTHLWMGGVLYREDTYPDGWNAQGTERKSGYCEFSGVPIDLNSTFYFAGVSTSMPIPIAFSLTTEIEETGPLPTYTVTFTDGFGNVLDEQTVERYGSAVPTEAPDLEDWAFKGWDAPYEDVRADATVNALWERTGASYFTVTFDANGGRFADGSAAVKVSVEEGTAAAAPDNPTRRDYTFTGWDPASFDSITENKTVTAQWISNDQVTANKVREKIAALPDDPAFMTTKESDARYKERKSEIEAAKSAAAEAGAAYNALTDDQRALIPDDERLKLVCALIAALPRDPYDVTNDHSTPIATAQTAYDSLPRDLQEQLDDDDDKKPLAESRSYGRYLESAVWALDSLKQVNNITVLKDGTYSTGIESSSSKGKSSRQTNTRLTVKSVKVEKGRATATVECSGTSYQTLLLGGKTYENVNTESGNPLFEIPINLNSKFHFSVKSKSATAATDGVAFEMTVSADESTMKPDPKQEESGDQGEKNPGGSGGNENQGQNNGSGNNSTSGNQQPLNAGGSTGTSGTGGNLSSMLRNSSTTGTSTTASGAAANASKPGASSSKTGGSTTSTSNLPMSDQAGASVAGTISEDLSPAIAGGVLLFASLGALAFALHFVRRESAFR